MSKNNDEYTMIRQEIMECYKSIDSTRNILYASITAILVFSLSLTKEPLILLFPYMVIIPIYLLNLNRLNSIHRAAAYLIVFHENSYDTFKWETRLYKLDHKVSGKFDWAFQSPYLFSSIGCTILFICQLSIEGILIYSTEFWIRVLVAVIFQLVILIIFIKQLNYKNTKSFYIEKWNIVKEIEFVKDETINSV